MMAAAAREKVEGALRERDTQTKALWEKFREKWKVGVRRKVLHGLEQTQPVQWSW